MKNSDLKPVNALEKQIFLDKEFLTAIKTGKSREFHREGSVKNHICDILEYIENKYKSNKEYKNLRLLAILHDVGKFAFLDKYMDIYLPKMICKDQNKFIAASHKFAKKYPVPKKVSLFIIIGGIKGMNPF